MINIADLLGLPKYFNCIFHDDKTKSANIFPSTKGKTAQTSDRRDYLYTCHSSNCDCNAEKNNTMNLFTLIKKIAGYDSYSQVDEFLEAGLNLTVVFDAGRAKHESIPRTTGLLDLIERNERFLRGKGNLLCPTAMKIAGSSLKVLHTLNAIAKEKNFEGFHPEQHGVLLSESVQFIAMRMKELSPASMKISQSLAILAYLGFLEKLPYDMVSTKRLRKMIEILHAEKNHVRLLNQIFLTELTDEKLKEIETKALRWKNKKYKKKVFSFKELEQNEGIFAAMRIYPQGCKVEKDKTD